MAKNQWLGWSQYRTFFYFLNRHSIKPPSNFIPFHVQISTVPKPHQRGFFVQWMAVNSENHH